MYYHPSLGELVDMLTIEHIKELKNIKTDPERSERIRILLNDISGFLSEKPDIFNSKIILLIISLAQINLCIWNLKDTMEKVFDSQNVKLGHQLNGIRNQLKNSLTSLFKAEEHSSKSNSDTDNIEGWNLSILSVVPWPKKIDERPSDLNYEYHYPIGELIDILSINQIKEMKFNDKKKLETVKNIISFLAHDIDSALKNSLDEKYPLYIECISLLALINIIIWENKDQMADSACKESYSKLLLQAQELNGIRNYIRNILLDDFMETKFLGHRAVFLNMQNNDSWYMPLLKRFETLKLGNSIT